MWHLAHTCGNVSDMTEEIRRSTRRITGTGNPMPTLRMLRLLYNKKQKDVAAEAGVRRESLCTWERGVHTPSIDYFPHLAEALGYRFEWVLTRIEES